MSRGGSKEEGRREEPRGGEGGRDEVEGAGRDGVREEHPLRIWWLQGPNNLISSTWPSYLEPTLHLIFIAKPVEASHGAEVTVTDCTY